MLADILLVLWVWLFIEIEKSKIVDEQFDWF
jgi:hypothetical protein